MRLGTCKIDLSPLLIVPMRYFCSGLIVDVLVLNFLCCLHHMYVFTFVFKVTELPTVWKIAALSAYDMFSWYKYLIVNLVFFPSRFLEWVRLFLIVAYLYLTNIKFGFKGVNFYGRFRDF